MTAIANTGPRQGLSSRRGWARFIVAVVGLALVVGTVLGIRSATRSPARVTAPLVSRAGPVVAANPQIESEWGIRFTGVLVLADGGVVEVRYQIVDPAKAGRIHAGGADTSNLPVLIDERTGEKVKPNSAMFHFHHGQTNADGRTYSILYGNAGGAIHLGDQITLLLDDGLKIAHIDITN
jgi:hypothetical protein